MKKLSRAKRKIQKAKWLKQKINRISDLNNYIDVDWNPPSKHGRFIRFFFSWIPYDGRKTMTNPDIGWFWHDKEVKDEAEFNRYESLKAFV